MTNSRSIAMSVAIACACACACAARATAQGPVPQAPPAGPVPNAPPAATAPASGAPDATLPGPSALPAAPAPGAPDAAPDTSAPAAPPTVLLVETHTVGVDPVVGRVANRRVRAAVERLGYATLDPEHARLAMVRLAIAFPPSMADLWRITYATRAERGVLVVVGASGGRYLAEVRVASRDGAGPFHAHGDADAAGLEAKLDALVREALPPPGTPGAPGAPVAATPQGTQVDPPANVQPPVDPPPSSEPPEAPPGPAEEQAPAPKALPEPDHRTWRWAAQTESAVGLAEDPFYVHLVGARADVRFGPQFAFGALAAYANLPGRDGRVMSLLTALQIEQRIALTEQGAVALPLRMGLGYLWRNGYVLRVASGVAIALNDKVDLVFDLAVPTFWVTPERDLFSLDFAVELAWTPRGNR